jgi:hypothetical protein
MISSKTKIGLLVSIHVVAGLLLAWAARRNTGPTMQAVGLFALVFAEAGLIGFWGGLKSTRLVWRLPAVLVATLYLWAVCAVATLDASDHLALVIIALTVVPILVVLSGLRHSRRRLRLTDLAGASPVSEGFQFSISHLLLATAIVALVLGIGRGIRTINNRQSDIVVVAVFPPCFVMVELATLWAALGIGRPTPRLAVVVPTAFIVGAIPVFYVPGRADPSISELIVWPAIIGLQSIITACSLLVVRFCGYRLVRGDRNEVDPIPAPPGT